MKRSSFSIILFLIAHAMAAQVVGKQFPNMVTETIEDKKITLPQDTKGKYTLVGLAYSKKSEEDLNSWCEPVFHRYIQKSKGVFQSLQADVNIYFIPMFTGINAAATGTAKRKAVQQTDPDLLPHLLFYRGELKPYKEALDFERKDTPYFFVLDKDGKIVYATSGKYTSDKLDEADDTIE